MTDTSKQAARWFAAERRGIMPTEERRDYERWLAEPANARSLARLRALWNDLDPALAAAPDVQPSVSRARVAAMVALASATLVMATHLNSVWWTSLDWWSR